MNTAFIGLDYIVDIMHESGKIARSAPHAKARRCIEQVNQALGIARNKGWLTILVKVGFASGYQNQPKHSPFFGRAHELGALDLSGPGTDFHPDLDVQPSDLLVIKPRISAFYATDLEAALRANRIERLVISGISTAWAVQSTVRDAHDRDYEVLVFEDGCAALNDQVHEESMQLIAQLARIVHLDDLTKLS